jgi:hypothetical protein
MKSLFDAQSSPFFGESIKMVSYCPLCENRQSLTETQVLAENEGAKLVYVQCKKCHTGVVAVVFPNPLGPVGLGSMGIVTDLTPNDIMKFKNHPDVKSDDAIDLHVFFETKGTSGFMEALGDDHTRNN